MTWWRRSGFALATKTLLKLTMVLHGGIFLIQLIHYLQNILGHSYHRNWGLVITGGGTYIPGFSAHNEIEVSNDGESFAQMSFRIPGNRQELKCYSSH